MRIDAIIPYERNARHNEKAVPVVAESIREFGLRGQIVLESRENPVIVAGHTRVAACKSLGWTEIPDENIAYCDGLTEEQIKAFRLADNRTGEVATWNQALLKSEIKGIDSIDMSRFQFDFKSKGKQYGAERLRTDSAYNLQLVNRLHCDEKTGMPHISPSDARPERLLPFNYAKSATDHDCYLHFFIDDYQFERLWANPEKYLPLIKQFTGCIAPDFSCYLDMPYPMQQWNEYRRRALTNWWQRNGVDVVPCLTWSLPQSYEFCFKGIPKGHTVAVSTVGVKVNEDAAEVFASGMAAALRIIKPERVLLYGGNIGFDFGGVEVVEYKANNSGW